MSTEEMGQKYGDDARFLVIDPKKLGFVPRQEHASGTESERVMAVGKIKQAVQVREVDVDVEMGTDDEVKEEKRCMQEYYEDGDSKDEQVVVIEEDDGVLIYSGTGTEDSDGRRMGVTLVSMKITLVLDCHH